MAGCAVWLGKKELNKTLHELLHPCDSSRLAVLGTRSSSSSVRPYGVYMSGFLYITRLSRFQVRAPPRERVPVHYQTVSSRSAGSAQKQVFRRAETPFHADEANGGRTIFVSG